MLVYRWEAPLFFANAGMFRQQIRRLVRDGRPTCVVLQCEAITDIDVTAANTLEQLDTELNAQGIHLACVELEDGYGTSSTGTACTKHSTATTSTTRSTRPSPPSRPRATGPPRPEHDARRAAFV